MGLIWCLDWLGFNCFGLLGWWFDDGLWVCLNVLCFGWCIWIAFDCGCVLVYVGV